MSHSTEARTTSVATSSLDTPATAAVSATNASSIQAITETLRARQVAVRSIPFEVRLNALSDLSRRMLERDPGLGDLLKQPGSAFLAEFLQPSALQRLVRREVPDIAMFSQWVSGRESSAVRLVPRGLVCHWLAGNVPLLGALSWAVSLLVGNTNLLRLSSRQADPVTPLLEALEQRGGDSATLASGTVVVRFERENDAAHRAMSEAADVRIAWGGREAVEAVRSLPAKWDCEDVILGPRASLAVIDPATMTPGAVRRLATDILYFDQQACSSPQTIFVREASGHDPAVGTFLDELGGQIEQLSRRIPRHSLDFGETYRIALDRTRVLLTGGELRRDSGTSWTIAIRDRPKTDVLCANRFVQAVPFSSIEEVLPHIPRNVQTIVTKLSVEDFEEFTGAASLCGVCRFPAPGEGNRFESPWDGIPLISRLSRWVTRSVPTR